VRGDVYWEIHNAVTNGGALNQLDHLLWNVHEGTQRCTGYEYIIVRYDCLQHSNFQIRSALPSQSHVGDSLQVLPMRIPLSSQLFGVSDFMHAQS
jgi:hypothetical protein